MMFTYTSSSAPSHRELMNTYRAAYNARLATRDIQPVVFPYFMFPISLLVFYLCIPHVNRPWVYAMRWPVLAAIVALEVKIMKETSTMSMATGFGAGLISMWGIVWSATWLMWNDPQREARRVERRVRNVKEKDTKPSEGTGDGAREEDGKIVPQQNGKTTTTGQALRQRNHQNGHTKGARDNEVKNNAEMAETEYYWQSYPMDSLRDRLDWVVDLVCNFRGPGWNWEVPSDPGLPPNILGLLGEPVDSTVSQDVSSVGIKRYTSRSALFRARFPRFVIGYLILDVLKVVLMKDPYFLLGPNDYPLPPHLASLSPFTLQIFREVVTLLAIITALETIFLLAPLVFCILLGPKILGVRGEPWMYPTTWGFLDIIFAKGLNGLWGGWWHQTFRYAFSAPTNYLIAHGYLKARSQAAKLVGLVVAFGISGALHASGSITQFPTSYPWHPPLFFMLQPVGILLQTYYCEWFKGYISQMPSEMRRAGNFAFTFTWLYCTAPLLVDDFARGGIWLFQPIPISPLRGMGFGEKGDGWWCWEDLGIGWHIGKHWWDSGLAL